MTIRADNWIRQMCETPTHTHIKANGVIEHISEPFSLHQQRILKATEARRQLLSCTIMSEEQKEDKLLFDPLIETINPITAEELDNWEPMITPFIPTPEKYLNNNRVLSFGISSYGYDVRLAKDLKIFTNINSAIIDCYDLNYECFVDANLKTDDKGNVYAILPPNSFMLGHTIEYFNIPRDVLVICMGKSTLARSGISINVTPIEPQFKGNVVIEIANMTNLPVKIYTDVGISQFMFFRGDEECIRSYADKGGKYQCQQGLTLPKV